MIMQDVFNNLKLLIFFIDDQSNSTYSNILVENIDSDIPITLNFTTLPKVTQTEDNHASYKF